MNTNDPKNWRAVLFDGTSSASRSVVVTRGEDGALHVCEDGQPPRRVAPDAYSIAPPVGKTPLCLRLSDGSVIQIPWTDNLIHVFKGSISKQNRILEMLERRPVFSASLVALAGLLLACTYMFGAPALSDFIAPRISFQIKHRIGDSALQALDAIMFEASDVSADKKARISEIVNRLRESSHFAHTIDSTTRKMMVKGKSTPNALALLPNKIIASDKIVEILDDQELEGVLAHEMGHLVYDHSTKTLVRASFVSLSAIALFGGDPGIFQSIALNLIDAKNSRSNEREADEYGVNLLKTMKRDPMALHRALTKLSSGENESELEGFLSTHPLTSERLRFIQELAEMRR